MTVCIAAIFENKGVVVATDRQITETGTDFGYESAQPKIFGLADHILAAVADDMPFQGELLIETKKRINERNQGNSLLIMDAADIYCDVYDELQRKYAERAILRPQNLTMETWEAKRDDGTLNETFVKIITEQLAAYIIPHGVQTIFAGIDIEGPGIYVLEDREAPRCESIRGFAAIGSGDRVAEAQFAFAGFSRMWFQVDACFLTYVAKKRSQVINSVGDETTVFVMRPHKPYEHLSRKEYEILDKGYTKLERDIERNERNARSRIQATINNCPGDAPILGGFEIW